MKVTIEISMYPLQDEYEAEIISFIQSIKGHSEVNVYTNAMSTYIQGDWRKVNEILVDGLESIWKNGGTSSTVMKIIPRELPVKAGFFDL